MSWVGEGGVGGRNGCTCVGGMCVKYEGIWKFLVMMGVSMKDSIILTDRRVHQGSSWLSI